MESQQSGTKKSQHRTSIKLGGIAFLLVCFFYAYIGVIFVVGPFFILISINIDLFSYIISHLVIIWFRISLVFLKLLVNTRIYIYKDESLNPDDFKSNILFIMNHRGALDWLYFFRVAINLFNPTAFKLVLKRSIKEIFGMGWVLQSNLYLFLSRCWDKDQEKINLLADNYRDSKKKLQLLLFCEGTFPNKRTIAISNRFAEQNNYPLYKHVLHPKSKGFYEIIKSFTKSVNSTSPNQNNPTPANSDTYSVTYPANQNPISSIDNSNLIDSCLNNSLNKTQTTSSTKSDANNSSRDNGLVDGDGYHDSNIKSVRAEHSISENSNKLHYFQYIYDCTIGYKQDDCHEEIDVVRGNIAKEFHVYIEKFDIDQLIKASKNSDDEYSYFDEWLRKRWLLKEKQLEHFSKYLTFDPSLAVAQNNQNSQIKTTKSDNSNNFDSIKTTNCVPDKLVYSEYKDSIQFDHFTSNQSNYSNYSSNTNIDAIANETNQTTETNKSNRTEKTCFDSKQNTVHHTRFDQENFNIDQSYLKSDDNNMITNSIIISSTKPAIKNSMIDDENKTESTNSLFNNENKTFNPTQIDNLPPSQNRLIAEELVDDNFVGSLFLVIVFMCYLSYCTYQLFNSIYFLTYFVFINIFCVYMSREERFFYKLTTRNRKISNK